MVPPDGADRLLPDCTAVPPSILSDPFCFLYGSCKQLCQGQWSFWHLLSTKHAQLLYSCISSILKPRKRSATANAQQPCARSIDLGVVAHPVTVPGVHWRVAECIRPYRARVF